MIVSKEQQAWINQVAKENPEALKMDGHDNAICGIARRCDDKPLLAYSEQRIINNLITFHGMDLYEAREFYEFKIASAWMGEGTPVIIGG